ncbi:MAG: hypothetical protein IH993_04190 [Proteobacteria bacterium]|nr:hypothetical protein [Pseudomonadota bacterium]
MFSPAAIEQVKNCDPDEEVTFVVQWTGSAKIAAGIRGGTRRERLSKLKLAFREAKRDVLESVRSEKGALVNDLPTSGEAIVTAPAATWEKLLTEDGPLRDRDDIRVLPNVRFHAISSVN